MICDKCDTCIDSSCEGCEFDRDKLACELAGISYFDAVERGL